MSEAAASTAEWAKLGTCAVSDAADQLGLPAALLGLRPVGAHRPFAGRAVTVHLGRADGRRTTRHLCTAAVDAAAPGDVIVIANDGRVDAAAWGGLLSLGATVRGVVGIVIDGACRDIDEAIELELPVYARAAVTRTARGRVIELSWGESVVVCGTRVGMGDLIVADRSGVVAVPAAETGRVLAAAVDLAGRESRIGASIRAGMALSEAMGAAYEELRGA